MRIRYWVSALVFSALLSGAPGKLSLPSGGSIRYTTAGLKTRFEFVTGTGRHHAVSVNRDGTVPTNAEPIRVELIGEVPDKSLIVSDSYPSAPLGLHYCQAGEERFLRIFTFTGGRVRQRSQVKLASCRDNIELAEPGVEWDPVSGTLKIHWLQGPSNKGATEDRTIHLQEASGSR